MRVLFLHSTMTFFTFQESGEVEDGGSEMEHHMTL